MKAFLVTIFIFITIHLFGQQFKTVNKEEVKDNYERVKNLLSADDMLYLDINEN